MILSAQSIRDLCVGSAWRNDAPMVSPFHERTVAGGMTFGLGPAGYDVRCAEAVDLPPGGFDLASTVERFILPHDVIAFVCDKSSWARRGLSAFNTVLEPGWEGYLTLELVNNGRRGLFVPAGAPIVQIVFQRLDWATTLPYDGKYQDQPPGPVPAIVEAT